LIVRDQLSQSLAGAGLDLGQTRFEALWSYVELLTKWNRRINLTGFSFDGDTAPALQRLVLEPLAAARIAKGAQRILDVGSGGGSPAIPFFLGLDQASDLVLVESRTKKAVFLREALRATGIPGRVVVDRFEQLVAPEPFDAVTVRAVAADAALWALLRRTLGSDGRLYWFHSASQDQPEQDVVEWSRPVPLLNGESRVSVGARLR
jgi:16S rRNA (guanine527-N7)-methyltransferase